LAYSESAVELSTPTLASAFSNSDLLIWPSPLVSILANNCDGDCATRPLADWPCSEINAAIVSLPNGDVPVVAPAGTELA